MALLTLGLGLITISFGQTPPPVRALHVSVFNDDSLGRVERQLPELARAGVNTLFVETDYNFQFKRRPEMAEPGGVSFDAARKFSVACRTAGIRPIPQINLLGHQSWEASTTKLLLAHPEFDETPGLFPENKGIYCRSYCPQAPGLMAVITPLIDEVTDAFQANAFHVGMDEVFLIGHDACPRCKGQDPAKLFAKAVNDLHRHVVKTRKLEMYMWADRLLDGNATGYGEWEAATNGTHAAIDLIPKDIVLCDWHYELRPDYPSLKIFGQKGFRILPSGWKDERAAEAFSLAGKTGKYGGVIGYLATTWGAAPNDALATWPPLLAGFKFWIPKSN